MIWNYWRPDKQALHPRCDIDAHSLWYQFCDINYDLKAFSLPVAAISSPWLLFIQESGSGSGRLISTRVSLPSWLSFNTDFLPEETTLVFTKH